LNLEHACLEEFRAVMSETQKDDKLLTKANVAKKVSEGKSD
jgi:hypothetical protein